MAGYRLGAPSDVPRLVGDLITEAVQLVSSGGPGMPARCGAGSPRPAPVDQRCPASPRLCVGCSARLSWSSPSGTRPGRNITVTMTVGSRTTIASRLLAWATLRPLCVRCESGWRRRAADGVPWAVLGLARRAGNGRRLCRGQCRGRGVVASLSPVSPAFSTHRHRTGRTDAGRPLNRA